MPKNPPSSPDKELTYEAAMSELDGLIARMESGQLALDDLLLGYARGSELLQICRAKLAAVEQQIKRIDDKLPAGESA